MFYGLCRLDSCASGLGSRPAHVPVWELVGLLVLLKLHRCRGGRIDSRISFIHSLILATGWTKTSDDPGLCACRSPSRLTAGCEIWRRCLKRPDDESQWLIEFDLQQQPWSGSYVSGCLQVSMSVSGFAVVLSGLLALELLLPHRSLLVPVCPHLLMYVSSACAYFLPNHVQEISTSSKCLPLLMNVSCAFTYQVSKEKGKSINVFTPQWCGNCCPPGHRREKRHLEREESEQHELTQPFWCICCTEILTSSLVCDSLVTWQLSLCVSIV